MAATPENLLRRLSEGATSAADLERVSGQSQSVVSRRLRELIAQKNVVRIGSTRGARYALLRDIAGIGKQWPLRRIGAAGEIQLLGTLHALAANEYYFEATEPSFTWGGLTTGLPYFLQDQRPGGFLGRAVPLRYPELALPQRVIDWNDDHYLRYLTQRGADTVGDLILGDAAFNEYLLAQRQRTPTPADARGEHYPRLVAEVLEGGLPGSSAHGEHPKFATLLQDAAGLKHVLVKFSPPISTTVGQRWSDLLVTEHLAHEVLAQAGLSATRSRIDRFADRTYLEMDRFDRAGLEGRIGVTSLLSIDAALYGKIDNWISSAARLHDDRRVDEASLWQIRMAATFAELIANTDRHFGNMALHDQYNGRFRLAPIYDMLPMLFAPAHDQVVPREFTPPIPTTSTLQTFARARLLAQAYWRRCAQDARISDSFRGICQTCLAALEALPRTGAYSDT